MKKLIQSLAVTLSLFAITSEAGVYTTNNMGVATATPSTTPVVLTHLTLFTTNTVATIVYLYDGFYTTTNNGYTNYTSYTTNQITIYTNSAGLTNTWTNTVIASAAHAVAANAGAVTLPLAVLVVPPSPGVLDINKDLVFANRLTLSNTLMGLSGVITYRTP